MGQSKGRSVCGLVVVEALPEALQDFIAVLEVHSLGSLFVAPARQPLLLQPLCIAHLLQPLFVIYLYLRIRQDMGLRQGFEEKVEKEMTAEQQGSGTSGAMSSYYWGREKFQLELL